MATNTDNDNVPQWKKDLIARLRNQNKKSDTSVPPACTSSTTAGHQPNPINSVASASPSQQPCSSASEQCITVALSPVKHKMVQERAWTENKPDFVEMVSENGYHKDSDSDSSEDLHYGPGIVNKLKNKYLSLALRESNTRPSILQMRKATSLENLLDDDVPGKNRNDRMFYSRVNGDDSKNVTNRYRSSGRRQEMKRARSVETISRTEIDISRTTNNVNNRQSLHEEMLIVQDVNDKNVNGKLPVETENNYSNRLNRPKRIQPLMNEKEKPQPDFVKQAKMIFESRPKQRTKKPPQTGDVAAKVDSFNNIIVKAKVALKKPPIKHVKPVLNDKNKGNTHHVRPVAKPVILSEEIAKPKILKVNKVIASQDGTLPSPIPDVSRVDHKKNEEQHCINNTSSLSETPDLILTSSPLPALTSPTYKRNSTETFIKEEIKNSTPAVNDTKYSTSPAKMQPKTLKYNDSADGFRDISPISPKNSPASALFNFTSIRVTQTNLPINENVSETRVPPSEPLKIEVNGHHNVSKINSPNLLAKTSDSSGSTTAKVLSPPLNNVAKTKLSDTEVEKNHKNTVKTMQQPGVSVSVEVVNKIVVSKNKKSRQQESTTSVFNFTSRKDVPDYISNDMSRSPSRPELPKPGEGGIILIPTTIGNIFTDEEEEILRSLEAPPSPCDVTFVNDNILIDGKSSLSQSSRRIKMRISFVDDGPEIYEYPSENSLLLDDLPLSPLSSNAQVGHTVPTLSGSTLANYTPKTSSDLFQPGVTRSVQKSQPAQPDITNVADTPDLILEEIEKPIVFSAGTNADILF